LTLKANIGSQYWVNKEYEYETKLLYIKVITRCFTNFEVHHAANNSSSVKIGAEKTQKERKLDWEKGKLPWFLRECPQKLCPESPGC
jgi:hypothetical protein